MAVEKTVQLQHAKLGNKASIRLRFLFTPEIIMKSRKPTSTFSSAGRAMTQIGIAPVGVGKGVVSGVGTGVGAVSKGVKSIFKKETPKVVMEEYSVHEALAASVPQPIPVPAGQNGPASSSASPPAPSSSAVTSTGTLRVDIIDGHELMAPDGDQVKPYVIASIGETECRTKHVSKTNTPSW